MNDKDIIELWNQKVKPELPLQKLYLKMVGFSGSRIEEILKSITTEDLVKLYSNVSDNS